MGWRASIVRVPSAAGARLGALLAPTPSPFDPTRSQPPQPTPGDTTPPVITLLEPTNAVLVP
jgi:hypothetical protein